MNSYKERENEKLFKVYVTDAFNIMLGLGVRYRDVMLDTKREQVEEKEERSAEEIKNSIKDGLNRLGSNTKVEV